MFKKSILNKNLKKGIVIINEESISLGNSDNQFMIFRKHKFTVVRPDLFGSHYDQEEERTKPKSKLLNIALLNNIKNKMTAKPDADLFIDIENIPNYVLVNPSQWGDIIKKNKDGSLHSYANLELDTLVTIRNLIQYNDENTIAVKFKLKEQNVK